MSPKNLLQHNWRSTKRSWIRLILGGVDNLKFTGNIIYVYVRFPTYTYIYQSLKVDTHIRAAPSRGPLPRTNIGASTKPLRMGTPELPSCAKPLELSIQVGPINSKNKVTTSQCVHRNDPSPSRNRRIQRIQKHDWCYTGRSHRAINHLQRQIRELAKPLLLHRQCK